MKGKIKEKKLKLYWKILALVSKETHCLTPVSLDETIKRHYCTFSQFFNIPHTYNTGKFRQLSPGLELVSL